MRASRLLSILILLQMRGRVSASDLAQQFEVTPRTIYRDIDQLSAAGVPVYGERGRDGGFALLDGYRTQLTGFTPPEAEALLLAGMTSAAADLGMAPDAAAAQLKLLASLPKAAGASAQRVAQRFHFDHLAWYARKQPIALLPALAGAVLGDRRIRIRYQSWKALVKRTLDPQGLVLKGGDWYLIAAVKQRARTYRVASILEFEVLPQTARRLPRFNLARYWEDSTRAFEKTLLGQRAMIRVSPVGLKILGDVSPAAAEAVVESGCACLPPGWVRAEIPVESDAQAVRHLLALGAEIDVLGPPALRAAMKNQARRMAALYRRA